MEIEARVNVTYAGQNGDLPDLVPFSATDAEIKGWATEAVVSGVPGISANPQASFADFVVDRFEPNEARPFYLISIRPKTPFGSTTR
jgi:hypothetical protein